MEMIGLPRKGQTAQNVRTMGQVMPAATMLHFPVLKIGLPIPE